MIISAGKRTFLLGKLEQAKFMFVQISHSYSGAGSANLNIEGLVCLSILLVAVVSG
jgi:hypothetical protein